MKGELHNNNEKYSKKVIDVLDGIFISINAFAVTIDDIDATAFITKVEYDSLVNDYR